MRVQTYIEIDLDFNLDPEYVQEVQEDNPGITFEEIADRYLEDPLGRLVGTLDNHFDGIDWEITDYHHEFTLDPDEPAEE